jgi:AAA+ superfamily predicted ATPase
MGVDPADILLAALDKPADSIKPTASNLLSRAFPASAVIETEDQFFSPWEKCELWKIQRHKGNEKQSLVSQCWWPKRDVILDTPYCGWFEVSWHEKELELLAITVKGRSCPETRWYIIAEDEETAAGFFAEVCKYNSTVRGEVLVFQEAYWAKDEELFESIKASTFEDLVLHGELKDEIRTDIGLFFEQEELYRRYQIPWKRGFLFLGPPGNGKTHMLKAVVNHFSRPCLYVKSLHAQYNSPQNCVAEAFERARQVAPCFFILEDLDTLLDDENRSFFLNEMDGFASNDGIVTIASCNFPERLDGAILERPSRFDRKYHFELPQREDRHRYFQSFMERFENELQLDQAGLEQVTAATEGYSYAYLKELYVSSAVRWVSSQHRQPLSEIMLEQADTLRSQMTTEPPAPQGSSGSFRFPRGFPFSLSDGPDL